MEGGTASTQRGPLGPPSGAASAPVAPPSPHHCADCRWVLHRTLRVEVWGHISLGFVFAFFRTLRAFCFLKTFLNVQKTTSDESKRCISKRTTFHALSRPHDDEPSTTHSGEAKSIRAPSHRHGLHPQPIRANPFTPFCCPMPSRLPDRPPL